MRRLAFPIVAVLLVSGCATGPWGDDDCGGGPCTPPAVAQVVPCPSGVRVELGGSQAAMGLRVHEIALVNCGTEPYTAQGRPRLELADADGRVLDVRIVEDVREISAALDGSPGPAGPVTLRPGERASAVLAWRNTYDDVSAPPVTVTFVRVAPDDVLPAQELVPAGGLDLGSTGRLGVGPWRADPRTAAPA